MNYVNCPSYASLFFALHLKNRGEEITAITTSDNIKKYCDHVNIRCFQLKRFYFGTAIFQKIFEFKEQIHALIAHLKISPGDEYYLLDISYTLEGFYIARVLNDKIKVNLSNLEEVRFKQYTGYLWEKRWLSFQFLKLFMKTCLGIDLILWDVNSEPVFGIGEKFLFRNKITELRLEKSLSELKIESMIKNYVKLKEYDNLIADQEVLLSGRIKANSILKLYEQLLSLNVSYVIKEHPNSKDSKLFGNLPKYPDYIPAELLLENIKKNVISIFSTVLTAACQVNGLRAVSMLELVEWENENYKTYMKEWLTDQSSGKIVFVKTLAELKELL